MRIRRLSRGSLLPSHLERAPSATDSSPERSSQPICPAEAHVGVADSVLHGNPEGYEIVDEPSSGECTAVFGNRPSCNRGSNGAHGA